MGVVVEAQQSRLTQRGPDDGGALEIIRRGSRLTWVFAVAGVIFAFMVGWRIWQQLFAWEYGLDVQASAYDTYWHSLLAFNLAVITLGGGAALLMLARGCKTCVEHRATYGHVLHKHEAQHIWRLWAIIAGFGVSLYGFGYFAEQDASWHQVAVRDTAFTPSHIVLFWGIAPIAVVMAASIYLYAATRVPKVYAKGVPLSLALFVSGVFLLFVWVAFNEWGHSFWIAEELFSAPLHWGFVIFAFMAFGLLSVFVQTLARLMKIAGDELAAQGGSAPPRAEATEATPAARA